MPTAPKSILVHACSECGAAIPRRGFCSAKHKAAFYNLMSKRGRVIMPLLLAAATRRYSGSDPEVCAYARRESDALISRWLVEDRAAGRSCGAIAFAKMVGNWRACDLIA